MKANQLKQAIKFQYGTSKNPILITSAPGVGKSSICSQVAQELGQELNETFGYIDIRASQKAPEEIGSVLYVENGVSKFTKPDWIPTEGKGIILIDEIKDAPLLLQSALYEIVLDRSLGGVTLGAGWMIMAAGNRQSDRAASGRLSTALANRFTHLELDADVEDTVAYSLENKWHSVIAPLLRFRPELLLDFDPKRKEAAFPSPRTWEFVSDILNGNPPLDLRYELLSGTVGQGAATELEGFLRIQNELPSIDRILKDPSTGDIPTQPAVLYALVGALASRVNKKNFANIATYSNRLPTEMTVLLMRDCLKVDRSLLKTKSFIAYAAAHSDVII